MVMTYFRCQKLTPLLHFLMFAKFAPGVFLKCLVIGGLGEETMWTLIGEADKSLH